MRCLKLFILIFYFSIAHIAPGIGEGNNGNNAHNGGNNGNNNLNTVSATNAALPTTTNENCM